MKKTKKFLLDEENTNEEILDEKFLEEEALDEEELEEESLEERTKLVKTWVVLIILSIVGICFIINFFNTCCTGDKTYHERECDWCGRFEECKMYTVSSIKGYNNNGTIKVGYDFMWFGDGCIYKAKNSGKWLKID